MGECKSWILHKHEYLDLILPQIPEEIRDLARQVIDKHFFAMNREVGALELAWRRGWQGFGTLEEVLKKKPPK